MAPEIPPQVLNVYLIDEGEDETLVGKVQYAPDGMLTLLQAEAEHEGLLEGAIESVNAKEQLVEKVPPPPDSSGRSGTFSKVTKRDDADFFPALQTYLKTYYSLSLG